MPFFEVNDDATGDIHFVRNKMSFYVKNKSHTALPISQWLDRLSNTDANKSALLAFRWAQFQAEQTYKPGGDWNQGMLSVGLPSGEIFNAILKWDIANKEYEAKLTGVQCAE